MLTAVSVEDYKAFDSARLALHPLTVLIGANSSGKSSLCNVPLMIHQTVRAQSSGPYVREGRVLVTNGDFVKVGEVRKLPKAGSGEVFSIRLEFSDSFRAIRSFTSRMQYRISDAVWETLSAYDRLADRISRKRTESFRRLTKLLRDSEFAEVMGKPEAIRDFEEILEELSEVLELPEVKDNPELGFWSSYVHRRTAVPASPINAEDLTATLDLHRVFQALWRGKSEFNLRFSFHVGVEDGKPTLRVCKYELFCGGKLFLSLEPVRHSTKPSRITKIIPKSEILDESVLRKQDFTRVTRFNAPIHNLILLAGYEFSDDEDAPFSFYAHLITDFLDDVQDVLVGSFNDGTFSHLGPLRALPRSHYSIDQDDPSLGLSGYRISQILRDRPDVRGEVNRVLAHYGLQIDPQENSEIFQLMVTTPARDANLNIADVGFGVSQIIPILVQIAMAEPASLTVVEQPEAQLHPNMQAHMADVFLHSIGLLDADTGRPVGRSRQRGSKAQPKRILVETHSSAFINRLRRRMVEHPDLQPLVAVYCVDVDESGNSSLRPVRIESDGRMILPPAFHAAELEDLSVLASFARTRDGVVRGRSRPVKPRARPSRQNSKIDRS